ncbi:MAG: winged helix-turn-helix transcriptional regulator [Methanobacterium sp.]
MKSTREKILDTLHENPKATISELAESVGINNISVRHHLTNLQAEGLIDAEEERHGIGRPRLIYFLTEQGLERFPTRYYRLANRLLEQLKDTVPESAIAAIFEQIANDISAKIPKNSDQLNMEQKLDLITTLLAEEGFFVRWEKKGDEYLIHESNCPYYQVVQSHPEVCSLDQTLISKVFKLPAEKINCVLHGDKNCTYVIPIKYTLGKEA